MSYRLVVQFTPLDELFSSLHTYICRKSHKKIDLSPSWPKETRQRLTPAFASELDELQVDADWRLTMLLVHLCPGETPEAFLAWLDGLTPGGMYELMAEYGHQFPGQMSEYRSRTLSHFEQWNEQYFRKIDPAILEGLERERDKRLGVLAGMPPDLFVDETTNGLAFKPVAGLEELVLVPQYHFQPVNIIGSYGPLTICYYSARFYIGDDAFLTPHEYRMIRSLGEKSRLIILKYLHKGPRSFIEIARHLGLSKGIAHDHISKLRQAGLIYAHFEGETVTEYSLRPKALKEIESRLTAYIEQD
ncbi:hypothetical protein J31TS4_45040 [Paenibacillus sp. J31TS4]|uniref:winged helix-turn-helix domain-containing protein n=1 Tax=Paenibacillus sp. J31TS4 TaxID=2807195 RepID=UPI001B181920|nr:winged helix-turn-helix domain-containing protein [Paenibacillus sp. J31TS4]GIP41224.1 hypothetical protein J31TS4_45040 [Paenibacillus sp. J31TS4]